MRLAATTLVLLGCFVVGASADDESKGAPTFYGEAGRILSEKCIACHRPGAPGRFALNTWEQARLFTREIQLAVGMRMMPPWPAVPGYGHFSNDRSLSLAEIETLLRWTDTGALRGSGKGPLRVPTRQSGANLLGVELAPAVSYEVGSSGEVETRCFAYPGLETDTWIRGIEVAPGDRRVVLHVRVFADPNRTVQSMDRADPAQGFSCRSDGSGYLQRPRLGDWAAGTPLELAPPGAGRELKAGTPIMVEVRYARVGARVKDATRVRLLTLAAAPSRVLRTLFIASGPLEIPADTWSFRSRTTWKLEQTLRLYAVVPYMTDLGTDFKARMILQDGAENPLVWVHDYDVNWQIAYAFAKRPLAAPAGSRIEIDAEFDNFETNPRARKGVAGEGRYGLALEYEEERGVSQRALSNNP